MNALAKETAQKLCERVGAEATTAARTCQEDCQRLGDAKAAEFWAEVAQQLGRLSQTNGERSTTQPPPLTQGAARWRYMQLVERYRHRAMQAEAKAGGSEAFRGEMIEIALDWLELARQAELLARL